MLPLLLPSLLPVTSIMLTGLHMITMVLLISTSDFASFCLLLDVPAPQQTNLVFQFLPLIHFHYITWERHNFQPGISFVCLRVQNPIIFIIYFQTYWMYKFDFYTFTFAASVYTVVCLSLERLLHLCRPHWSNKVLADIWISTPPLIVFKAEIPLDSTC